MKYFKLTYLRARFFWVFSINLFLFVSAYFVPEMLVVSKVIFALLCIVATVDLYLLYGIDHKVKAERKLPFALSLGDENIIKIDFSTAHTEGYRIEMIDELPAQFQKRDFSFEEDITDKITYQYPLKPTERGEYSFGNVLVFLSSSIGFFARKYVLASPESIPVYPSIIAMKNYSLYSMQQASKFYGVKKMRRIGQSYEFEQIKEYILGDDLRNANWKATARTGDLKINHFQEEKSQQVYTIIDKGRTMNMPFDGMSLLDYAINAALVISNVALQKQDKAGLITFSDIIGNTLKAQNDPGHISRVLRTLYKEKERDTEANYELLYQLSNKLIHGRSLLFLFTNIESEYSLERILPILRKLNQRHILIVVFFKNSELENYGYSEAKNTEEIYLKTIAEKMSVEKEKLSLSLNMYGIQTIYTEPENLTLHTLNKYLELKSRGMI